MIHALPWRRSSRLEKATRRSGTSGNAGELAKKDSGCERPLFRMDISSGSDFMGMIVVLRICVVLPQYCGEEAGAGELRTHDPWTSHRSPIVSH